MLILSLHVVELEDMEHNCWDAAHIPRVNELVVWHFVCIY